MLSRNPLLTQEPNGRINIPCISKYIKMNKYIKWKLFSLKKIKNILTPSFHNQLYSKIYNNNINLLVILFLYEGFFY